jgi:quercetin dioxygenase-like cupin family protein
MADLAPGALIAGKYRVASIVAEQATTTTYACSADNTRYFVKVLKSIVADDREDRGRFEREFRVLRQLKHPCIASVVGVDKTGSRGIPCIVMEHLEGETLDAIVRRGPLDQGAAVGLLMHLLSALQLAHARGIVHRDLGPGNLFIVRRDDGTWHLKIFNFGAAHTSESGGAAELTQVGTIVGTAEYMSPEQARGERVDGRADLYAAGCLAYAMLTGGPPFVGAGPSVLLRHAGEMPSSIRARRRDVAPDIEKWVMRALAKEPGGRFRDANEAREALLAAAGPDLGRRRTTGAHPPVGGAAASPTALRPATAQPGARMIVVDERSCDWVAALAGLPSACQMARLEGDPTQQGPFTIRLRFPVGTRLLAHTHPRVERVTVLAGSLRIGEGRALRVPGARRLGAGSYYVTPPDVPHFMWADEDAILQVSGMGPWSIHYVEGQPADAGTESGPKRWLG